MSRKKKRGGLLLIVLAAALIAVAALILWKQWEYGASEAFYDGLRGTARLGGVSA